MEKVKQVFDSKITWLGLGSIVGGVFGEQAAAVVNAFGIFVMAVL
jgi:hypothetical protein